LRVGGHEDASGILQGHLQWRASVWWLTTTRRTIFAAGPKRIRTNWYKSGPLGGDQQLGAMICEGRLDVLIFFIDPLSAQPHDVDVKALTRLATLYDVPLANNKSTADAVLAAV
jgi:methylglyoxal synthase